MLISFESNIEALWEIHGSRYLRVTLQGTHGAATSRDNHCEADQVDEIVGFRRVSCKKILGEKSRYVVSDSQCPCQPPLVVLPHVWLRVYGCFSKDMQK